MQWHGIESLIHLCSSANVGSVGNVSILENFLLEISGDFPDLPTLPKLFSLFFNEKGVIIYDSNPSYKQDA